MKISKLELENIKCFGENVTIDFNSERSPCDWALILGDNGTGKTTILRSIALSLVGKESVGGLLDELYGDWVRHGKRQNGLIRLELVNKRNERFCIQTEIKVDKSNDVTEIRQETEPDPFPWDKLLVCGFGADRSVYGDTPYREYFATDATYTLFNYRQSLQNTEIALGRIYRIDRGKSLDIVLRWLEKITMLPRGCLVFLPEGLVKRSGKTNLPIMGLGDGHLATLTLLADLIGWASMFYKYKVEKIIQGERSIIDGIVLIDEIEQHLHPSWQKNILRLLNKEFPRIQFIVSTHSALCAVGTTDLTDEQCKLFLAQEIEDDQVTVRKFNPPRRQRADQVLTSYLFGLNTSGDNETIDQIERYSQLVAKKRTSEEERELRLIRTELDKNLGTEETELQRLVAESVEKVLEERSGLISFDKQALDYEIKRQLQELLKGTAEPIIFEKDVLDYEIRNLFQELEEKIGKHIGPKDKDLHNSIQTGFRALENRVVKLRASKKTSKKSSTESNE